MIDWRYEKQYELDQEAVNDELYAQYLNEQEDEYIMEVLCNG